MSFARVVCKPFVIKKIPSDFHSRLYYCEVLGMGYHPETYKSEHKALLSGLPRIALDIEYSHPSELEALRLSLRTGERGDGKIFILPVEQVFVF